MFFSPKKPFQLPVYAEDAAQAYADSISPTYGSDRFSGHPRVLEFLDLSADECSDEVEEHFLDDGDDASSSLSCSVSITSCSSSPSSTNDIVSGS